MKDILGIEVDYPISHEVAGYSVEDKLRELNLLTPAKEYLLAQRVTAALHFLDEQKIPHKKLGFGRVNDFFSYKVTQEGTLTCHSAPIKKIGQHAASIILLPSIKGKLIITTEYGRGAYQLLARGELCDHLQNGNFWKSKDLRRHNGAFFTEAIEELTDYLSGEKPLESFPIPRDRIFPIKQ